MDYLKIYNNIIERAKNRTLDVNSYFEKHHIKPKGIGGDNDPNNLVNLTYREHFVCHWMLHRIYPKNKQISAAFHIMVYGYNVRKTKKLNKNNYIPSSRSLEEAKIAQKHHRTGTKHSEETKQKMRDTLKKKMENGYICPNNKGRITSDETKKKQSKAKIGKKRTQEIKDKISETKKKQHQENIVIRKKMSQETKDKIRQKAIESHKKRRESGEGYDHLKNIKREISDETRKKMKENTYAYRSQQRYLNKKNNPDS